MNELESNDDILKVLEKQKKFIGKPVEYKEQLVMLCDTSGSMEHMNGQSTKLLQLQNALIQFSKSNRSGKLHLLAFSNDCVEPLGDDFTDKVFNLSANGGTYLIPGLLKSLYVLDSYPQVINRRVILFSDGKIAEPYDELRFHLEAFHKKSIKMDCIGFGRHDDLDEDLLRNIAEYLGGTYQHADTLHTLTQTLLNITTERRLLT